VIRSISLWRLTRVFTWTGILSIGGGRAAFFYEALVVRRRWLTTAEFLQDYTLAQLLPGPNVSNLAITLGHRLAGLPGAGCALLAVIVPGLVVLLALATVYFNRGLAPATAAVMHGMAAGVVGLLLVTSVRLMRPVLVDARAIVVAAGTFAAVGPLHLNTAAVLVVSAALSVWLHRPGPRA
jgi:chromate transporter